MTGLWRGMGNELLPRDAGEGDRKAVEGARRGAELELAPSVTLRIRSAPPPPFHGGGAGEAKSMQAFSTSVRTLRIGAALGGR